MKKIYLYLLTVLFLTFSQINVSFSQPRFIFSVTAGFSLPVGDFKNGIASNDTVPEAWPYLMRNGYNIGVTGKYAVNKSRNINLVLDLNYNGFKNWGNIEQVPPANTSGSGTTVTASYEFIPKVAILNLSFGAQYSFKPKETFSPFAGLDFTANFFSGSFQTNPTSNFPRSQLKAETRFGIQVGGGADITFNNLFGGVFGIKYNLANLFAKGDYESDVTSQQIPLNDNSYANQSARNISYFQFYAGVTFNFGRLVPVK